MVNLSVILPNFNGRIISAPDVSYQLFHRIGLGAYGAVHLARDLLPTSPSCSSRLYAVKCLMRYQAGSDYALTVEREICLHKAVSDHPNIVTLHNVVIEDNYVFLVMDYCPGGDLFSAIMDQGLFEGNDEAVKKAFLQLIDALETAHEVGIFHRDLKPENILCSLDYENVYISDFGLATQADISYTLGCGSEYYMSPECVGVMTRHKPYATGPSDVWALGVILSNLVTGRNPWHCTNPCKDGGFRRYLISGAPYLQHMLPISGSAAYLMSRIFDPNPRTRITLPELRKATLAIDTFFDKNHPLCTPSPPDPYKHLFISPPRRYPDAQPDIPHRPTEELQNVDVHVPPPAAMRSHSGSVNPSVFPIPPTPPPMGASSSTVCSYRTSRSLTDSGGPVTPPTTAHNPTIISSPEPDDDIPEISLEEPPRDYPSSETGRAPGRAALRGNRKRVFAGIGMGIGSIGSDTGSRLSKRMRQYRIGESAQRFVGAMRELKLRP